MSKDLGSMLVENTGFFDGVLVLAAKTVVNE
jgi:hypothetical protein